MSFKVVLQGSVMILLFAYVALGPYSAYYHQTIDQARAPIEIAYRAISNAIYDVYLLATNPTEWYARQQVINVRPERPLDFPKGLEVVLFDARPASVSGGAPFTVDVVVKNDGFLDARDVTVAYSCNQWCSVEYAKVENALSMDDIKKIVGVEENLKKYGLLDAVTKNKVYYVEDKFQRGESGRITISNFVSKFYTQRAAETNFARIFVNISYATSTNTSLKVTVISNKELNDRFSRGDTVFKPVTAISKPTPGQVSLNVGPQPLKSGSSAQLLVSVFNTRDFSKIILYRDSEIILRLPNTIGTSLNCDGLTDANDGYEHPNETNMEIIHYKVKPASGSGSIEILPYEFRSIYAFVCRFTAATIVNEDAIPEQSGLITAELPNYIFRNEQKKDIPITPPLGIIFDPFEQTCNKCGAEGVDLSLNPLNTKLNECTEKACRDLSQGDKKCWYGGQNADLDYLTSLKGAAEAATNTISRIGRDVCHSCRLPETSDCSMFTGPTSCNDEDTICGLNCFWNPNAKNAQGLDVQRCEAAAAPSIGVCGKITQNEINGYNMYKDIISSSIDANGLRDVLTRGGYNPEALVSALISQESGTGWDPKAVSPCAAAGLMQFVPGTARDMGLTVPSSYGRNVCNPTLCQTQDGQVTACNACTPNVCDYTNDERFNPQKSIPAGVKYLAQQINKCGDVKKGIAAYNSGNCAGETNTGYTASIVDQRYPNWVSCFQQGGQTSQETCSSCLAKNQIWCTSATPSETSGTCIPTGPCNPATPNMVTSCPAPIPSSVAGAFGTSTYCSQKISKAKLTCEFGEGGCASTSECNENKVFVEFASDGSRKDYKLECRNPGLSINVCCIQVRTELGETKAQSDANCKDAYNIKSGSAQQSQSTQQKPAITINHVPANPKSTDTVTINFAVQNPPASYGFLISVRNENTGNDVTGWEACPITGCTFTIGPLQPARYSYQARIFSNGQEVQSTGGGPFPFTVT